MDNGRNRLADFVGVKIGPLSRDAVQAAWVAMTAKGKQKGKDLVVASRIREAILDDQTVDEKTGAVSWGEAALEFRNDEDFTTFAKAVDHMVENEGVIFELATGAVELQAQCDAKAEELKAAKKAAEAAREPAKA